MNRLIYCCWLYCLPLHSLQVTSAFGYRIHPVTGRYAFHAGIDLRARSDTVYAVLAGSVTQTGYNQLLGLFVQLNHGEFQTTYGHLSQFFALPGDSVSTGEPIGITGNTGRVTGEHLHFAVQYHNRYINPLKFLYYISNHINPIKKETNK